MSELAVALLFAAFVGPSPAPAATPARAPDAAASPAVVERITLADDVRQSGRGVKGDTPKREGAARASRPARGSAK